jgi:hypothetical protein
MRATILFGLIIPAAFGLATAGSASAGGQGQASIGYVILDEAGNLGVNQETYNLYEGPSLSLEDFQYISAKGLGVFADLRNVTLDNRNLHASVSKLGRVTLSVMDNQYRRTYDFEGSRSTRRRTTGMLLECSPIRQFSWFAGFSRTHKQGDNFAIYSPVDDTVIEATDYSHSTYNVGGRVLTSQGSLRAEYRRFTFSDNVRAGADRQANDVDIVAFVRMPRYDRVTLSGGYRHRQDRRDSPGVKLTTKQGWGAARVYLPYRITAEYRFLAARTEHTGGDPATDHFVNTASVSRDWKMRGGVRVGYENRVGDDLIDRSVSHSVLFAGWVKPSHHWTARARFASRMKEITTGTTLVGDEDMTRHQVSVAYLSDRWGDVSVTYQGRIRTNDDIDTRVDYNSISASADLRWSGYGKLTATYAYNVGQFENRGGAVHEFEFADHVVTGSVRPVEYRKTQVAFGGTYYRSQRDRDTEKFSLHVSAEYLLPHQYRIGARYEAANYDNFLVTNQYYTGNIVNVYLIKSFTLE